MDGLPRAPMRHARRAAPYDVLDMVNIARRAYSRYAVDWGAVSEWLSGNVNNPDVFFAICGRAAVMAAKSEYHWCLGMAPLPQVAVPYIAGVDDIWGVVRCLRQIVEWGRSFGAKRVNIDAETGIDLGPLVKRVGLPYTQTPTYSVRIL